MITRYVEIYCDVLRVLDVAKTVTGVVLQTYPDVDKICTALKIQGLCSRQPLEELAIRRLVKNWLVDDRSPLEIHTTDERYIRAIMSRATK